MHSHVGPRGENGQNRFPGGKLRRGWGHPGSPRRLFHPRGCPGWRSEAPTPPPAGQGWGVPSVPRGRAPTEPPGLGQPGPPTSAHPIAQGCGAALRPGRLPVPPRRGRGGRGRSRVGAGRPVLSCRRSVPRGLQLIAGKNLRRGAEPRVAPGSASPPSIPGVGGDPVSPPPVPTQPGRRSAKGSLPTWLRVLCDFCSHTRHWS